MRNWYVITGGPSAGKTTLIKALEASGLAIEHEAARYVIDEEMQNGKSIEEIRGDEYLFQKKVYNRKREREAALDPNQLIFLDRGLHDTVAYLRLNGSPVETDVAQEVQGAQYRKAFLLEPVAFERDYARTESLEDQRRLFSLLYEVYEDAGIPVEVVPPFTSKGERISYFLERLANEEGVTLPG